MGLISGRRELASDTVVNSNTSSYVSDQRSGGVLPPTYLAYVDKYGQIVGSDFKSKISINIDATYYKNDSYAQKYSPMVEGSTTFTALAGAALINGISFTGAPGSTFKVNFNGDGIDTSKPANVAYMQSTNVSSIDYNLYVQTRNCEVGEYFTS